MLPLLHDILIRYQIGKIDIVVNIQQAFLQTEIDDNHRECLQFIWFDNALSIITNDMLYYILQELFSV